MRNILGLRLTRTLLFQAPKKGERRIKELGGFDNRCVERMPGECSPGRELSEPAKDNDPEEVFSYGQEPQLSSCFHFFLP